jgi:hypothetical protein
MKRTLRKFIAFMLMALMATSAFGAFSTFADNSQEGWAWPVPQNRSVFSGFNRTAGRTNPHNGIDISQGADLKVIATRSGTVVTTTNNCRAIHQSSSSAANRVGCCGNWQGNHIVIDHGNGYRSVYAHLRQHSLTVAVGDWVPQGFVIGVTGSSGQSQGRHLHFEIRRNGVHINVNPANTDIRAAAGQAQSRTDELRALQRGMQPIHYRTVAATTQGSNPSSPPQQRVAISMSVTPAVAGPMIAVTHNGTELWWALSRNGEVLVVEPLSLQSNVWDFSMQNLADGVYRFEAQANRGYGTESELKVHEFEIRRTATQLTISMSVTPAVAGPMITVTHNGTELWWALARGGEIIVVEPLSLQSNVWDFSMLDLDNGVYVFEAQANRGYGTESELKVHEFEIRRTATQADISIHTVSDPIAGGVVSGGGTFASGTNVTITATPSSGWEFIGWYEGNTRVSSTFIWSFVAISNRTIEARFRQLTPQTRTVTIQYNANGGTGAPASHTATIGADGVAVFNLSNIMPTRSGHEFLGWSYRNDLSYGIFRNGQQIEYGFAGSTGNQTITFFAVWGVTATARPTTATVLVNGQNVRFQAYNINDNNYFKLRDIAYALNGTSAQFYVGWDEVDNAIFLVSGYAYQPIGGELQGVSAGSVTAMPTVSGIFLNGERINPTAFNINGSNYFMLRDLAAVLGFGVDWDGATSTILITTN